MKIEIPAKMHDLGGALHKFNAPRVMRAVDGDFVLTVKIASDFTPGARSTNPRSVPYLSSGVLLWSDSENFIRLERGSMRRGNQIVHTAAFEEWEGGYAGAVHNERFAGGDCYLRLERRGSRILGAISNDGRNWKQLHPIDTVWPSKLKVGLHAVSTSSDPFTAKFEEFELKTKDSPSKQSFNFDP
jgi:regulation of enolase protein 1 (concanavalin A-like superfamily)